MTNLKTAAVYTRFSTDGQKQTSTDDQLRNALALAAAKGYTVPPELVFSDEAISGSFKALDKRTAYHRLLDAWQAGKFEAVFADEVTRLARDKVELAQLERRIQTSGVHLFTVDGTDTTRTGWSLVFSIKSIIAAEDLIQYGQRSRRGMLGTVKRGFQVGAPPFGYRAVKVVDGAAVLGTRFEIHEEEAQHVRLAFQLRASGKSLNEIAEHFNRSGVPGRTKKPSAAPGNYWRAAQVHALLETPFYAGWFTYPVRDEVTGKVTETRFEREHLRLVSDELWQACQSRKGTKFTSIRGGVSHYLAGLVRCGACGSVLRLQNDPQRTAPAMRCASCESKRLSGLDVKAPYVSSHVFELAMKDAVRSALTPEVAAVFRARLTERLTGGADAELLQVRNDRERNVSASERLVRLLSSLPREDEILSAELRRLSAERDVLDTRIAKLEKAAPLVDKAALKKQLAVNPRNLVDRVFSKSDPAALGARLRRFFDSVTILDKPDRFTAVVSVCFVPGAIAAELTSTAAFDTTPVCFTYTVKQKRVKGGRVTWSLERHEACAAL